MSRRPETFPNALTNWVKLPTLLSGRGLGGASHRTIKSAHDFKCERGQTHLKLPDDRVDGCPTQQVSRSRRSGGSWMTRNTMMHYNHLEEKLLMVKLSCRSSVELVSAKVAANAPPSRSVMRSCGRNEERSERGETHAHACTPSLPPSLRPRSRTARPRGGAATSSRCRRRLRSRPAVPPRVSFPLPPPSFPLSLLSSLPSVLFVFHLFARCVVTLGELAGGGPVGTSEHRVCAHAFLLFPQLAAFVAAE